LPQMIGDDRNPLRRQHWNAPSFGSIFSGLTVLMAKPLNSRRCAAQIIAADPVRAVCAAPFPCP
jgi:hypothetical protein